MISCSYDSAKCKSVGEPCDVYSIIVWIYTTQSFNPFIPFVTSNGENPKSVSIA